MLINENELRTIIRQVIIEEKRLDEISGGLKKAGMIAAFVAALAGSGQVSAQDYNKPKIAQEVAGKVLEVIKKNKACEGFFTEDIENKIKDAKTPEQVDEIARSLYVYILENAEDINEGLRVATKFRKQLENALKTMTGQGGGVTTTWSNQDFKDYKKARQSGGKN